MADIFVAEYRASLEDLTFNSKPLINTLTMLADENKQYSAQICIVIQERLRRVSQSKKLPVLYLLDSIVKNLGGVYVREFEENLVDTFVSVFQQADEKTRKDLYKLRVTWKPVFSVDILRRVDNAARRLDPNWPVLIEEPKIHVNPAFLKQGGKSPVITQLQQQEQLKQSQRAQQSAGGGSDADRNQRILEIKREERSRLQRGRFDPVTQNLMQRSAEQEQLQKDQVSVPGAVSVNDTQTAVRHQPATPSGSRVYRAGSPSASSKNSTRKAVEIKEIEMPHMSGLSARVTCSENGVAGIIDVVRDPRRISGFKQPPDLALPRFLQELHAEATRKRPVLPDHREGPPAKRGPAQATAPLMQAAPNLPMQPPPFMPMEQGPQMIGGPGYPPGLPFHSQPPPPVHPGIVFPPNAGDNFPRMDVGLIHGPYPHVPGMPPLAGPPVGPIDHHGPVLSGPPMDLHRHNQPVMDMHAPAQPVGDLHSFPMGQRNNSNSNNRQGGRKRRKDQLMRDFDEIIAYTDDELLRKYQYVIHRSDKIMSAQILKPSSAGLLHDKLIHLEMLLQQQSPDMRSEDSAPSRIPDVPSLQATHPRLYERMKRPPSPRRRRSYHRGRVGDTSREGSPGYPDHSNDAPLQSSGEQSNAGPSSSQGDSNGPTDLHQLLLRLNKHGMLPAASSQDLPQALHPNSVEMPTISLEDSEQLARVYPAAVEMLYTGKQCSSCGWRFTDERAAKYGEHLDWHYRLNTLNRTGTRSRNWMLPAEDWLSFVEGERLEDRVRSHIFDSEKEEVVPEEKVFSCPKLDGEDNKCCAVCSEELEMFWHPEEDEWHYRDAVRVNNEVYHDICRPDGDSGSEQAQNSRPSTP